MSSGGETDKKHEGGLPTTINRSEAVKNLRGVMKIRGNQPGWEEAWQQNLTPWEAALGNVPQPALVATMEKDAKTKDLLPKSGKALVPGCGRGQDVEYLAKLGFESTGIDISQRAVESAQEWLQGRPKDDSHARVHFVQTDYFALTDGTHHGQHLSMKDVDLIYDYTFFCAIPPELHNKWAAAHALALKPGGKLFTLVFPLRPEGNDSQEGPPYYVTPKQYKEVLRDKFVLEYEGEPLEQAPHKIGQERIMIWRLK